MLRFVLGVVKGLIIGGAVGYGVHQLGWGGGFNWITYGVIGALVGLFVGRPLWSHLLDKTSTVWTAIIKGLVGYGVGVGLFALVAKVWGGFDLTLGGETHNIVDWQPVLGAVIGALYGAFVELDDAPAAKPREQEPPAA